MGEKQRIEITFGEGAGEAFAAAIMATVEQYARTTPSAVAPQPANPYDVGLEPWAFHDPRDKVDVMAYVDDHNQVRHVPVNRTSEVPKKWRRVWLEDRS